MIEFSSVLVALVMLVCATGLLVHAQPNWFVAALAVFMYGHVLGVIALSRSLSGLRARLRLPPIRAYRLKMAAFAFAGCLVVAGAFTLRPFVFAAIVALHAAAWAGMWVWALRISWNAPASENDEVG